MKPISALTICLLLAGCANTQTPGIQSSAPGTFMRHGDIVLDLKTNKTSYRDGEPVVVNLSASRRSSVRIFNEDAAGARVQLWPNAHSASSGIVEAGKPLVIPAKDSAFLLKAAPPYGINTIVAVASAAPFRPTVTANDFFVDRGGMGSFASKGIAWSPTAVTQNAGSTVGEARLLYQVTKD